MVMEILKVAEEVQLVMIAKRSFVHLVPRKSCHAAREFW